jgi:hypothetical protein
MVRVDKNKSRKKTESPSSYLILLKTDEVFRLGERNFFGINIPDSGIQNLMFHVLHGLG